MILQHIRDWHLALFVACLVLIDLVILVPTTATLSTRLGATLVLHEENLFDVDQVRWSVEDIVMYTYMNYCRVNLLYFCSRLVFVQNTAFTAVNQSQITIKFGLEFCSVTKRYSRSLESF